MKPGIKSLATNMSSSVAPEYVLLTLGRTRLLFPRSELLALEETPKTGPAGDDSRIGMVERNGAILPVYNFDEHLQLLGATQDTRRTCVCLGDGNSAFGILCDKAEIVNGAEMQINTLPVCMRSTNTPVQALALQGTRILCISSMERIAGLIKNSPAAGAMS